MTSPGAGVDGDPLEEVVVELLAPGEVTPWLVERALRRARRLGLYWRILTPLERALLNVAAKLKVERYRSPKVKALLAKLIARIEAHTLRGEVIRLGLRRALSTGAARALLEAGPRALVEWARRKLGYIRYLGRSMLVVLDYFTPLLTL